MIRYGEKTQHCPSCGTAIQPGTSYCPECEPELTKVNPLTGKIEPLNSKTGAKRIVFVIMVVIILVVVLFAIGAIMQDIIG